jgi:hypothetical protein
MGEHRCGLRYHSAANRRLTISSDANPGPGLTYRRALRVRSTILALMFCGGFARRPIGSFSAGIWHMEPISSSEHVEGISLGQLTASETPKRSARRWPTLHKSLP